MNHRILLGTGLLGFVALAGVGTILALSQGDDRPATASPGGVTAERAGATKSVSTDALLVKSSRRPSKSWSLDALLVSGTRGTDSTDRATASGTREVTAQHLGGTISANDEVSQWAAENLQPDKGLIK